MNLRHYRTLNRKTSSPIESKANDMTTNACIIAKTECAVKRRLGCVVSKKYFYVQKSRIF